MKPISILGSAITDFGELWDKSLTDLLREAALNAVQNAHLELKDIEAVYVANMAAGLFEGQLHLGALVSQFFPHNPPALRVEGACASGSLALLTAEQALLSGQYKTVLVVGAEKMTDVSASQTTQYLAGASNVATEYGSTFPALYAILAQAHMQKYGTTREQLSAVSAKNHHHALTNPHAQFRKAISAEQVSASPLVAAPLRVLDCSPISDGAAAVVLSTKKAKKSPQIIGFGHGMDSLDLANRQSLTSFASTKKAAEQAFQKSGLTPQDIQLAEVHDCFTIAEFIALEDLGFFAPGKAAAATQEQKTTFGSNAQTVINPSGGLKACGHPVGATGVKQLAFLSELLRSRDGEFQNALTHNVGGSGATAVVHILQNQKGGAA